MKPAPLQEGCPWADWERPNVKWCEDYVCSWIVTPANTWSNLAYLIAAYLMHVKLNGNTKRLVWLFVPATIMTGLTSFAFHASVSRVFQLFDFFGMFTFIVLGVVLNLRRDNLLETRYTYPMYLLGMVIAGIAVPVFEILLNLPIQATVLALVIIQLVQEIRLRFGRYRKHPQLMPPYKRFKQSLLFLAVALACSVADLTRVWCDPATNNYINGHASWHVLSAIGLYCLFLFYHGMDFDKNGEGVPLG